MPPINHEERVLEEKLASIDRNIQEIRHDVANILRCIQHELDAMREREFWREYRDVYQDE